MALNPVNFVLNFFAMGRLTTQTDTPVPPSDRLAQSTLFYTPFTGNILSLFDGSQWIELSFEEFSLSLTGEVSADENYDAFAFINSSGVPELELSAAWTNDVTRADALTMQNGFLVKSADAKRLYLGTIRGSATNQIEDSSVKRFLSNHYNQTPRGLLKFGNTTNWSYTTTTIRQANADTGHQVEIVTGVAYKYIDLTVFTLVVPNSGGGGTVGIGVNSTTTFSADCLRNQTNAISSSTGILKRTAAFGYNVYSWNEIALGTGGTFYGDDSAASGNKCGMIGSIQG